MGARPHSERNDMNQQTNFNPGAQTAPDPYYGVKRRRSATPWIIGIAIALVVILCASCFIGIIFSDNTFSANKGDNYVGVLHIEGTIASGLDTSLLYTSDGLYSQTYILNAIEEMKKDVENRGILLYVNTPGGEMYAGDDVYQALLNYKKETGRPIYAYFAQTAASGGYYVAMAADEIYAHRLTTTGSIGVTYGTHIDLSGLCEKLGITTEELASGNNKGMGSYFAPLTDEQRAIYQSMIDEYYDYFVDVIVDGRGMSREEVLSFADGRVFTAKQALDLNLIDGIMDYESYKKTVEADFEGGVNFATFSFYEEYAEEMMTYMETLASVPSSELASVLATIKPLDGPLAYYSGH